MITPFKSTYSEQMNKFLSIRQASLKTRTIIVNTRQLKSFDDYLARNNASKLNKEIIDGWISTLKGSESTIQHTVCTVRLFIQFLVQSGKEAYIPTVPKCHDEYVPYIFSDDEIDMIIKTADSYPSRWNNTIPYMHVEFPIIIRIALCSGLRLSECVCLKMRDFHEDDGILIVKNSKGNKSRMVPMHESLTEILQLYTTLMNIHDPDSWLFPGKGTSEHVASEKVYFRFAWVLQKNGIVISKERFERGPCFHCLRHVFVLNSFKQLIRQGICMDDSIPYLSIYLGHSNLMQTEKYMKFTTDMFEDEFHKFDDYSASIFPEVHYEES